MAALYRRSAAAASNRKGTTSVPAQAQSVAAPVRTPQRGVAARTQPQPWPPAAMARPKPSLSH